MTRANSRDVRDDNGLSDERLTQIMEDYLARLEQGGRPSRQEYMERHPELAPALELALNGLEFLHQATNSVRSQQEFDAGPHTDTLLGDFRILRELGRGGMGIVYEAEQVSLGRRVAIKVLPFAGMLSENQLQRFKNEARAAAGLHHPHIVNAFFVSHDRGVHYYAMRLVEGTSLAEILAIWQAKSPPSRITEQAAVDTAADTRPLAQLLTIRERHGREAYRWIANIGIQAADALQYAHSMGVVHRDIKPANLLIDRDGHLWLTDFGLASTQTDANLTLTGDLLGTLRYMSPEQAAGEANADARTDIYSLGVTLYELLTLQPALTGDSRLELMRQLAEDDARSLRSIDMAIPQDLETIVLKSIAKVPADRYATAGELRDDLQRFLNDKPVVARRPSRVEQLWRAYRNNRLLWRALGAAMLLIMVLAVGGPIVAVRQFRISRELLGKNYAMAVTRAYRAWEDGQVERAAALLSACPKDAYSKSLRGFEWDHLWNRLRRAKELPSVGWISGCAHLAVSPDGLSIAAAGLDGHIRICDAFTLAIQAELIGHERRVLHVAFLPGGEQLISIGIDRTLRLWDVARQAEVRQVLLPTVDHKDEIAVSPDQRSLAVTQWFSNEVQVWNLDQFIQGSFHEPKYILDHFGVSDVAISQQGLLSSVSRYGSVKIWRLADGQLLAEFQADVFESSDAVFTPDGSILITGDTYSARFWDTTNWKVVGNLKSKQLTDCGVACSPNGAQIAMTNSASIEIWDIGKQRRLAAFLGHGAECQGLSYAPDGKALFAVYTDGIVRRWSVPDGRLRDQPSVANVEFVGVQRDGLLAIACAEYRRQPATGWLRIWSCNKNHVAHQVKQSRVGSLARSPLDPNLIAAFGVEQDTTHITLWDVGQRKSRAVLTGHQCWPMAVAFSPSGRALASAGSVGLELSLPELILWDLAVPGGRPRRLPLPPSYSVMDLAFAPDGQTLITVGGDWKRAAIVAYDVETCKLTDIVWADPQGELLAAVCFSPDGHQLAAGGFNRHILVFDWPTCKLRSKMPVNDIGVMDLVFSPDGTRLVSGGEEIRFWNARTGEELGSLLPNRLVYDLQFSGDSTILAAGCGDGTVQLYCSDGDSRTIIPDNP
jgi:WD40 repeat protein/serine/threonine protein kinase